METYIGTILAWAPNFAPYRWAYCGGQLMSISQNTAMFALLGTTYGGDGRSTFGLPNLKGRVPVGYCGGRGPGLDYYALGQIGGWEEITLNTIQMPTHSHGATLSGASINIPANTGTATTDTPSPSVHLAKGTTDVNFAPTPTKMYAAGTNTTLGAAIPVSGSPTVNSTGGSQAHENRQPYLVVNWVIALYGLFPPRS